MHRKIIAPVVLLALLFGALFYAASGHNYRYQIDSDSLFAQPQPKGNAERRMVDMIADDTLSISDVQSIENAAKQASEDFRERFPHSKDKLVKILEVMLYAHSAATLRKRAEETFSTLQ